MAPEPEEKDGEFVSTGSVLRQVLFGLVVAFSTLMTGFTSAWPVVLPKLQENPRSFNVTDQDVAWLVSVQGIVGMCTSLLSGHMVEYFGPRKLLLINLFPTFGLWLLMAFTSFLSVLYLCRIGLCISTYIIKSFFQAYIAELCQAKIRGAIAALPELIISVGVLVIYILANFFSYEVVTALCAVPFLPLFFLAIFLPESPYWLMRRNRTDDVKASLQRLRGQRENVNNEVKVLTRTSKVQVSAWSQIHELRKRENILPILLVLSILSLREISGQTALFSYSVYMFRQAGVEMDAFLCTVLLGCVRVVTTIIAVPALDRAGRRPFLIGSSVICGTSQLVIGFTLLMEIPGASWVPLAGLLIYVAAFGLGQAGIPWILMGELLPTPVRSIGSSIITFTYCLLMFIVNYIFFWLLANIRLGGTLCLFAFANVILVIIAYFWLPETKGRSLENLEVAFVKRKRLDQNDHDSNHEVTIELPLS
ncbi:facilitated trehalose transporter Tret1-like [Palaemon carinicauda]|uniref:facilitated trehalose transporter Tret1-like n=1 Tax=Palaemon carinicauda TaxID=392227 RepID=UPI0035B59670